MRFRKLRIAWSVVCGIACVLLIVLWVRSYWYDTDPLSIWQFDANRLSVDSARGSAIGIWFEGTAYSMLPLSCGR